MSAGPAGTGGNTNQVSGYEAVKTKQSKGTAKEINKGFNVGTYGDTKTGRTFGGEYSKENQNPNDNIQTKKNKNITYNNNGGGGNGNNTITQVTKTAPTTTEISQATTTEAEPDTEANRLLKIKKKGRSQSIISGSKGVTGMASNYSLGKKSLLGQV